MNKFYATMSFLLLCCVGLQFYYSRPQWHREAGGFSVDDVDVNFAGPIVMSLPPVQNIDGSFINFYVTANYYVTISAHRREVK